jgi:hypothetical protein
VPKSELFLNEASFTGENPSSTRYRPLFWIHFGGPGGSHLENLTGVSLYYGSYVLYSLGFYCDATHDLDGAFRLGRSKSDNLKIRYFPIDGAGGEIIESVEVTLVRDHAANTPHAYNFLKHGALKPVKVSYSSLFRE